MEHELDSPRLFPFLLEEITCVTLHTVKSYCLNLANLKKEAMESTSPCGFGSGLGLGKKSHDKRSRFLQTSKSNMKLRIHEWCCRTFPAEAVQKRGHRMSAIIMTVEGKGTGSGKDAPPGLRLHSSPLLPSPRNPRFGMKPFPLNRTKTRQFV